MTTLHIERLNKTHLRNEFICSQLSLQHYLHTQARQEMERQLSVTYVLLQPPEARILGYYSLSAFSLELQDLPLEVSKKLPRYPLLPAILIGRLAVDSRHQKKGFGVVLLINALQRALVASNSIGAIAVVVDAIDEAARQFYLKFGFQTFLNEPSRLFLPMKTIAKLIQTQN